MRRWLPVSLSLLLGMSAPAAAQTVTFTSTDPLVIPAGSTASTLFEATLSGKPASRVYLDLQIPTTGATILELRDDGTGGDRRAGDLVYSALLPTADIVRAMRADDVQRVFIGYLNVTSGSTNVLRANIFVSVYSDAVGTATIVQASPVVQLTSHLVNIWDPAYFTDFDATRTMQLFYRVFGDDYDFINLVTIPNRFQNRVHGVEKNDVDGIGLTPFDDSQRWGSAGRLKGISLFPIDSYYDGADVGYVHETGHQWIDYLKFPPLADGNPHWPLSSMAGGVMGFSVGGAGGEGGDFACNVVSDGGVIRLLPRDGAPVFGDLDLYLMGLVPPEQVGDAIVFNDQAAAQQLRCTGQTYTGSVTRLSVQDVIARVGPRRPAAGESQKQFRAATVLVSRDGLVSPETMWLYSWLTSRAELRSPIAIHEGFIKQVGKPFFVATGGRASIDTTLVPAPASVPGPPTDLTWSSTGSSVRLTWSASTTGGPPSVYRIEAGSVPGARNLADFSTGSVATSFAADGVASGTYYVRVAGANALGAGPPSNEVPLVIGSGCTAPPSTPTHFTGVATGSSVQLTWTISSGVVGSYVVEGGSGPIGANLFVTDTGGASPSFTIGNLGVGVYYLRLRAKNACGLSGQSNLVYFGVGLH